MGERDSDEGVGPVRGISLSARIERLFNTRLNPETGREYTLPDVEAGVRTLADQLPTEADRTRAKIGRTYIWQLKSGIRTNPTIMHLKSLATFFDVPISYFVDDIDGEEELERRLEIGAGLDSPEVRRVMYRVADADPGMLAIVLQLLEHSQTAGRGGEVSPPRAGAAPATDPPAAS